MNGLPFILLLADSFLLPLINLSMLISYLIMGNRFSLLLSYQYYITNIYLFLFPHSNRDLCNSCLLYTSAFTVYLPKSFEHNKEKKYPILYLLHGMWEKNDVWANRGHIKDIMAVSYTHLDVYKRQHFLWLTGIRLMM